MVTQIDPEDIFEVFLSTDSASVAVGRTLELEAFPLDELGAFLSGLDVAWSSASSTVADVDQHGVVTGVSTGTTLVIATAAGVADTAVITVAPLPLIGLSDDSVQFSAGAGGADPAPDSVVISNGGGFELIGLAVDSITYGAGASGWLAALVSQPTAPAALRLTPSIDDVVTAATYTASVWISAIDAENSPARVRVTLAITAGLPATVAANAGDAQSAAAGSTIATAPTVRVIDAVGNGVPGVGVAFAVASGGGSVTGANAITDSNGIARVGSWTLGTVAGANNNSLTATAAPSGLDGNPVTFTATALPAAAATVSIVAGNGQSATVNAGVTIAPRVVVRDAFSNPVPNHPVTFQVTGGGGTALPATPVATDASGEATLTSWTLGTTAGASNNTLLATATGVVTPAQFVASATAGAAAVISVAQGDGQSATVATNVPVPPRAVVRDAFGNAVGNQQVTFFVSGGGGSVSPLTAILTDVDGFATATSWTLGTVAGSANNTLGASVVGVGTPATFTASAIADVPVTLDVTAGASQSATVGSAVGTRPRVLLRDQFGNPVGGHDVTFQVTGGGGSTPNGPIATGSDGTATVSSWTLGTVAGLNNNVLTATAAGTGITGNPATFTASATAGVATTLAVDVGDNQSATVATPVGVAPRVIVRDQYSNPVPNVAVTFEVTGGAGAAVPAYPTSVQTQPDGTAAVSSWTLGTQAGSGNNTLRAAAAGVPTPVTFTASATAGAAFSLAIDAGDNQSATVSTEVAIDPRVIVRDQYSNPVSGVDVTFQVTAGGGIVVPASPVSVQTLADGTATATSWTLGSTAGLSNNTLQAAAAGVPGMVTFTASASAGGASSLVIDAGNNQSAAVNTALTVAPRVIVRDGIGNPIQGALVIFQVTSGGGAVVPAAPTAVQTLADGSATVTSWTLGTVAGTNNNTLQATVAGVSPVSFTASANAGAPSTVSIDQGNNQSTTVATAVPLAPRVIVRDQYSNPVQGATVTFAVSAGGTGAAVVPTTAITTGVGGTATVTSWTLGQTAGTNNNTLQATAAGVATPVSFTASATAGAPFSVAISAGNNQSATVATSVSIAPQVIVRDQYSNAIQGASVTFAVTAGGTGAAVVPTAAITTLANGSATVTSWTLGQTAGTNNNTLRATAAGVATPVDFIASANAGLAIDLTIDAGDGQAAVAGFAVGVAPTVAARDQYGNGVSGQSVVFTVISGGGNVTGPNPTTGATGLASVGTWTLGASPGANTLRAVAAGIPDSVTFTATGIAGQAQAMALQAGDAQTDTVGATLATAYAVRVVDSGSNGVPGVPVTWTVTGGGGSITAQSTTNGSGIAVATRVLGTTAGTQTASASVGGLTGSPVTFTATATTGAPFSVAINAGNNQSAAVATTVPTAPQVIVRDRFSNPVQGASVTFAVTAGGTGSAVVPTTAITTGVGGTAAVTSWTLGQTAGTNNNTLRATAAGVATPVDFTASATAGAPFSVAINAGNNQSATVATAVATAPQVIVRDQFSNPVPSASVTFAVIAGGTGAAVVPTTAVSTLSNGTATVSSWTLGQTAGTNNNTLRATAAGVATPVDFTASANAGAPFSVAINAGNNQSATVTTAVATAPQVIVRDQFSNPVQNASVTFAVTAGGTGAAVVPTTAITTLANGTATVTSWTLGQSAGTNNNTLQATAAGVATPVNFTASAAAGAPFSVAINAGNNQSATVATAVATAPQVIVRDQYSNPVQNASVTFAVIAGGTGAAVVPTTSITTLANGTATVTSWTLGQAAGTSNNTLQATAGGVATPVNFSASATAGAPFSVAINAGNNQSATVATAVLTDPQVIVRDQYSNPVQNASVTFAVIAGGTGAAVVPTTAITTGVGGTATVTSWTVGQTAGTNNNTLRATAAGVATPVDFTASATAGAPFSVAVNAGNNQSATVATAVLTDPQVIVRDQYSNPVQNASVTFAVTAGGTGAAVVPTTAITTLADGTATVTSWTVGQTAGTNNNTLQATAAGVATPVNFTASATAGSPFSVTINAGNNQSATVATAVLTDPQVIVRDQYSNPVPNASVTFAVIAGGTGAAVVPTTAISTLSNGTATVTSWTVGQTAGTNNNTLRATASGVATPVDFTASATAGAPFSVAVNAGNNQSATVATAVLTDPQVIVRDQYSNPVQNASVTFAVTAGGTGAAVVPTTAITTLGNGTATVTSWTVGQTAGTNNNTLRATAAGVATPVNFTASATAGAPFSVAVNAGNNQSATVATAVATDPQVIVRDQYSNPVQNASVTFAVTAGGTGAAVVPTTAITTLSNGTATVTSWTVGQTAGTNNNTLQATASGVATPVSFTASATAGAAASIVVSAGNNQTNVTVNTAVPTDPQVLVRDQFNNPVASVSVTFAVTGGGGAVTGGSQTTNVSGLATVTSWTLGNNGGSMTATGTFTNTLSATASGVATPASFTSSARYSFATHVNPIWAQATASPPTTCTGCHAGTSGGSSSLSLGGSAAQNYIMLVTPSGNNPVCDPTLTASGYRRVSTLSGQSGRDLSLLWRFMQASPTDIVGACGSHFYKATATNIALLEAWIRNGAPNN